MSYVTSILLKVKVKVKHSCARVYHEAIWRNGSTAPCILIAALYGGERSTLLHNRFNPGKMGPPDICRIGAWVRLRAGLPLWREEKSLASVGNRRRICWLQRTARLHGSGCGKTHRIHCGLFCSGFHTSGTMSYCWRSGSNFSDN